MTAQTWLITGVSSGFGRELAVQLLDRGDTVIGTVRRPDSAADLLQKYPDTFRRELLDVTDAAAVRDVVDRSFTSLGRIDVVVSNAGQVAFPGNSLYHATKWGIEGFAESVAQEVAPFGIGMTIVEPGGARTEFRYGSAQIASPLPDYDDTPAHGFLAMEWRSCLRVEREEAGLLRRVTSWASAARQGFSHGSATAAHDVHERGRSGALHVIGRAGDSRADLAGIVDGAFRVPGERAGEGREVGGRPIDLHPDVGPLQWGGPLPGEPLLVLPVVVVGTVVEHDDQQRQPVIGGDPQRARVEHQVSVRLQVDDQAAGTAMREGDAEGDADLGGGAERGTGMPVGSVEIPQPWRPSGCGPGGQHPVMAADNIPDFCGQP